MHWFRVSGETSAVTARDVAKADLRLTQLFWTTFDRRSSAFTFWSRPSGLTSSTQAPAARALCYMSVLKPQDAVSPSVRPALPRAHFHT